MAFFSPEEYYISSSALKIYVCRSHDRQWRARNLPWPKQRIWNFRNIHGHPTDLFHHMKNRIQRLQSLCKLHHLGPQNSILCLHCCIMLSCNVDPCHDLTVLSLQLGHLVHQIIQVLLLPHPRSSRRLSVREHPSLLPLIHHMRIFIGPRVLISSSHCPNAGFGKGLWYYRDGLSRTSL